MGRKSISKEPTEADLALVERVMFDPKEVQETCENIRRRLQGNHVVYQWQFQAFVRAYDQLNEHVQKLSRATALLEQWALLNREKISIVIALDRQNRNTLSGFRKLIKAQLEAEDAKNRHVE